ncbi:hypothetical protein HHK36_015337 [Tetracentron sinense]|uniref:Glutathione S-transferase n=1 Tax=Tetracentron sinense TaxID=13715 RepID=A0A834Z915_TETSI|nr:hypothetical protein HHK36_015337 [Tetracentron sinense]
MAEVSEVKLFGMWGSSYSKRVELALKLKGIPYEYVEEDLYNKSQLLLHYNPVHKKVPVLVHNERSISESLVILEYIDKYWNNSPLPLLPHDPYQRAKVRFWANFYDQKFLTSSNPVIRSEGEEQEKAIKEFLENFKVLEEDFAGKFHFLNGKDPGFLDFVMGSSVCNHRAIEEAIGADLIDPQRNPMFFTRMTALKDHPVVKDHLMTSWLNV